jgi:hypothetical protein
MSKDGAVKLFLKKRSVDDQISIPGALIRQALAQPDPGQVLLQMLSQVPKNQGFIHDKRQLENIVYWVAPSKDPNAPPSGVSVREDAKWFGLRIRVERLDDTKQGWFTLNRHQYDQILDRLNDPEFQVVRPNIHWTGFVDDFMAADGQHFEGVSEALSEDFEFEKA